MEVENKSVFEFLGTTMVGSMVYFNLTFFLSIPWLSSMKSDDLSVLKHFDLFVQNWSCFCSLHNLLRLSYVVWCGLLAFTLISCTSSMMFSKTSLTKATDGKQSMSWFFSYRFRGLGLEITSATTFFLPSIGLNLILKCCNSSAHLSKTWLDIAMERKCTSGFWSQ